MIDPLAHLNVTIDDLEPRVFPALLEYLGDLGHTFFSDIYAEHGSLNVVLADGQYPHSVHFNEGTTVRNWIRRFHRENNLDPRVIEIEHFLDDNWEDIVIKSLNLTK